ncbi:MAG: 16S rRNA pseudouridine(516) synthase [Rugosibacter sp.]|nr:16S rRNA pseudouridine(516) synthase [Rugosibacter sp.]
MKPVSLQDALYSQGFGTRRQCLGLVQSGQVLVNGQAADDAAQPVATAGLVLTVAGQTWPYHAPAYLMLHKPAGVECSQKPSLWPSVYSLLPAPLRQRPQKGAVSGVQAVGRLDQDTTGLLLLTDDGHFIHRMNSPRHQVPKLYEVTTCDPLTEAGIAQLLQGVVLDDDPQPVRAAACVRVDAHHLRLTLTQGKYHQVKRMLAAVGNRVEALHRSAVGGLHLPQDLLPGQWRWLGPDELARVQG